MQLNKSLSVLMLVTSLGLVSANQAMAQTASQEQELEQDEEVTCETGAYGQDTTCTVDAYQKGKQSQTITLSDGTQVKPHAPINTSLDTKTTAAVTGIMVTGVMSVIARRKLTV